jgi:hypothetical protein
MAAAFPEEFPPMEPEAFDLTQPEDEQSLLEQAAEVF